jgi:hypothetical protein
MKTDKNILYFFLFAILQLVLFPIAMFSNVFGFSEKTEEFFVNYLISI